ncbi:MAG TPA: DUF523 domain-containing protein [Fusibacter sp.]|nr:DUF523 domain-containing protein [Fusibacter sp.]
MIIVSACFANIKCRFDGDHKTVKWIQELVLSGEAIPVCPEVLGGLPIPRPACEIVVDESGTKKVIDNTGIDRTEAFVLGAEKTLAIAEACGAKIAILKANSPSCGKGFIYDGSFSSVKVEGNGLAAQLLLDRDIKIFNEDEEVEFGGYYATRTK